MDKAVKLFLAKHTDFEPVEYEGKLRIKCSLTGHEMPPKLNLLEEHQKTKRYIQHKNWYSQDFSKYEPYILPSRKSPYKLFCTLTKEDLNKIPKEIENHVNGKRFRQLKEEFEEKKERRAQRDSFRKAKADGLFDAPSASSDEEDGDEEISEDMLANFEDDEDEDEDEEEDSVEMPQKKWMDQAKLYGSSSDDVDFDQFEGIYSGSEESGEFENDSGNDSGDEDEKASSRGQISLGLVMEEEDDDGEFEVVAQKPPGKEKSSEDSDESEEVKGQKDTKKSSTYARVGPPPAAKQITTKTATITTNPNAQPQTNVTSPGLPPKPRAFAPKAPRSYTPGKQKKGASKGKDQIQRTRDNSLIGPKADQAKQQSLKRERENQGPSKRQQKRMKKNSK